MKPNRSRYAVLGRLALGPASGYDIRKYFSEEISHCWKESPAQVYAALRQLEAAGEATSETVRQERRPDRFPYTITDSGRKDLDDWLARPSEPPADKNETLLKILLGSRMDRERLTAHLERYRDIHLHRLQELSDLEKEHETPDAAADRDHSFWLMTLDHARRQSRAAIEWSEACLERLEAQQAENQVQR